MYRILVADNIGAAGLEELEAASDVAFDVTTGLSKRELLEVVPGYDALIVRSSTTVDQDVLAAAAKLRVIGRAGAGVDNIDVQAATRRGVVVTNTPHSSTVATAEQAIALMLAASRHIPAAHASVSAGRWERSRFAGIELFGKTLGLIGFGRVGRQVASRAAAFGMTVLATDPFVSEAIGRELGVQLVDLDELLGAADFLSLHAALSDETENLINAETIELMKPGVTIVNAARGGLIDEVALAEALAAGRVRMAAIDVFRREPPEADNPLVGHESVIHTPHLGGSTLEAQADIAEQVVKQVLDALRGTDFRNSINLPFHSGSDAAGTLAHMQLAEKMGILQYVMAGAPPRRVEVEVRGDGADELLKPVATGVLKGLLQSFLPESVNYVNAPVLADEYGIEVAQMRGLGTVDYPNLISCRVFWDEGKRVMSAVLFAGQDPRIVQVSDYHLDAKPEGTVLLMLNDDVPGVIGEVGTLLGHHQVNIAEWRLGRDSVGGKALSFINLDSDPSAEVLAALREISHVIKAETVHLP